MLHDPQRHLRRQRLGPAAPEFGWERFNAIAHDLPALFVEHGKEISPEVPLGIDWDQYYALDIQGVLRVLTVRVEGSLVGYVFTAFGPPLNHKQEVWAQALMYWLDPLHRQGWTGFKMFKALIRGARDMNAAKLTVASTLGFSDGRVTKLLQRLGLKPTELLHSMRLV
jgi:GNAT superfamily N-acetyltransferase